MSFLFGVLGNVTLLIVTIKHRNLRNAPNILISNLAIADLLFILVTGPTHFENEIHPCWFSGKFLCALKHYAPVVFRCTCVYSLVALSRERYLVIVVHGMHTLKSRTKLVGVCWAMCAWVVGFIVAAPILTTNFATVYDIQNITVSCQAVERRSSRAKIYEVCKLFITYLISLIAIAIHCSKMAHFLIVSTTKFKLRNPTFRRQRRTRMRLAYMTIVITLLFGLSSLPSVIFDFMFHFKPQNFKGEIKFRHLSYFMSLANSSLNPWLIFYLSSAHRECLKMCIFCRKPYHETQSTQGISQSASLRVTNIPSNRNQTTSSRVVSVQNSTDIIKLLFVCNCTNINIVYLLYCINGKDSTNT